MVYQQNCMIRKSYKSVSHEVEEVKNK